MLVFGNTIDTPFHYDDLHSIKYNPHIRSLSGVANHFVDPGTFSSRVRGYMYRPVLMTSYSIDYALWGGEAGGFRRGNLLLHLVASFLFGVLARRWIGTGAGMAAGAVPAILFLIHPLHSEVVDYVSSRSDLLVAVFCLACLVVMRATQLWPLPLLYLGALLSKSVAVLPVISAALTFAREGWVGLRQDRWRHGLLVLLSLSYLCVLWGTRFLTASFDKLPRSPLTEVWTQAKAFIYYLWLTTSPVHSLRHRRQLPARGLLFSAIAMLPYLLIPLNIVVAEWRAYLASCGLFLSGVWAWRAASHRWGSRLRPVGIALCLVFASLTIDRNDVWASELSLWSDAVSKNPASLRPRLNLALAYKRQGELSAARAHLQEGLRLDPNFAEGWVVFGELLHAAGRQTEALKAYRRGAALDPTMAGVFHNLGNVAMALGWTDSAVVHYEHVLSLEPNFVEARNNLGRALEDQGRWSEALTAYRRCVADSLYWTNTDDPVGGAWFNRARAADHLGYLDEAFSYLEAQRRLADDERFADTIALSARQLERLEQR